MAKHPKPFQTVEGRALNTKRSLISIATMAALGLVASPGGAASVQYDGLGIKTMQMNIVTLWLAATSLATAHTKIINRFIRVIVMATTV